MLILGLPLHLRSGMNCLNLGRGAPQPLSPSSCSKPSCREHSSSSSSTLWPGLGAPPLGGLIWFLSALLVELPNNGIYSQTLSAATLSYVLPCTLYHGAGVIRTPFFSLIISPIVQKLDSAIYSKSPRMSQIHIRNNRHRQKRRQLPLGLTGCTQQILLSTWTIFYLFCFMCLFLLLRYNSQSTKYMLLKCTLLCFLYSQVCVTTYFQNISIISKDSHPFRDAPLYPFCPLLENTHMLSVCMDLIILDISYQSNHIIYGLFFLTLSI